jgi:fumarate hydratase subunit beta
MLGLPHRLGAHHARGPGALPPGGILLKKLRTPLSEEAVRELTLGDEVKLSGTALTARDEAHLRALEAVHEGKRPFDIERGVLYHCGPVMRQVGDGWIAVAAGPTTSARMNSLEPEFIRAFRPAAIIGKGGMSRPTVEAMKECACVYLAFTGGAAAIGAEAVTDVKGVMWLDLGMAEAVWTLELFELGPLIVAIDAHGNSLYEKVAQETEKNLAAAKRRL